jgi:hypothetical protein
MMPHIKLFTDNIGTDKKNSIVREERKQREMFSIFLATQYLLPVNNAAPGSRYRIKQSNTYLCALRYLRT